MTIAAEERKLVTVLFADLVGSTALADDQDPERTRARLDRFYNAMSAEIEAAGGTIEKFAGDAVMAAFGAPEAVEDHAERALHAALSMQRRLQNLFPGELSLRIGVNTGEVVVGEPRAGSSFVSGDAVNVAARLEQAAEPGEILAGERTVAAVRGAFEFGQSATVAAKGKPGGVPARRVRRALTLMRPRGVGGLARAFVGRDEELAALRAAYRRAAENSRPVLVTIVGDAGVGKTRLVRELWERLAEEDPEPVRRTGRCLAYGQAITYWPLAEVLKEHLGILESDPPDEVRRRLGSREILGLTLGLDVAGDFHPLAARDRLHEAWITFLSDLGTDQPVVLLVEDVHWAEVPLLDLLERLARDVDAPLLLLATARPDFVDARPGWGGPRVGSETIWLEPLAQAAATTLVGALLASDVPPQVRELVVDRAEGNPFFVEEVLGSLIDQGVLERQNGSWVARDPPRGFAIPDSVQAVLAARIDLLDEAEKAALQSAAVIGRIFWTSPVYELVAGMEPDFRVLEDRDFIRRRSRSSLEGEPEYAFKHALTREVAYAGLPKARRARLHAAFADWILRFGGGRDEHAPLLAHHYAEAVRPEDTDLCWEDAPEELDRLRAQAVIWLERAAHLAVSRYEIDEALALLHRAIELGPDGQRRAEIWRSIGRANALKYDGEAFWAAMQNSLQTCRDRRTCADTYAELAFQTAARSAMWNRPPDKGLVEGWVTQALKLAEPGSAARVKALIARTFWDAASAGDAPREASVIAEDIDDVELRSFAFEARATALSAGGHFGEACDWAERRLALLDEISDPDHRAMAYWSSALAYAGLGRFADARRLTQRHADVASRLTPHHCVHAVGFRLTLEELAGGWPVIRDLTGDTEHVVAANLATPCVLNPRSLLACAIACAYLGDEHESRRLEAAANELGMDGYSVMTMGRLRLALARGDLGTAGQIVEAESAGVHTPVASLMAITTRLDALAALRDRARAESEAPQHLVPNTYIEPFALRALGVVREDAQLITQAVERFAAMQLPWHADQTRALV